MIPFKKINLGNSHALLKLYMESGYIGLGDAVFQFEKELAEYTGAKYALALNSCTSALFLSLKWEVMHGLKKVIIPSMTVPLVANAVLQAGLQFEFHSDTAWVGDRYLLLWSSVIDSAHRIRRMDYRHFDPSVKICYSFYPTKSIGSADGGAIVTDDKEFIEWARQASVYGRNQATMRQNSWDYEINMLGYKLNWNNLQAVIALEQLRRLDKTNERRKQIYTQYNKAFGLDNDSDYLYRIKVKRRDEFIKYMLDNGVECGVHFKPLHLMDPFKDVNVYHRDRIEKDYRETVSLPLYDLLTDQEVETIIKLVKKF
jgi:dTDP-4-amino-4,6-dideoxygalactose transaminase